MTGVPPRIGGGVQTHRWAWYFGALYRPQDVTPS